MMLEHDVVGKSSSGSSNNKYNNNETDDEKNHLLQQVTTIRQQQKKEVISTRANCAIQGLVATILLFIWQLIYTLPNIHQLVLTPMALSNTSPFQAIMILGAITLSNLVHSLTFYVTLKYLPGGATSAGILKGLQAVLVFCFSSIFLCERDDDDNIDNGGKGVGRSQDEMMCWSTNKAISLLIVLCGIASYTRGMTMHGAR
jgi:hypothetical protein